MGAEHWSDEEILAGLYGAGPVDRHPDECADCRQRWELMRRRQEGLRLAEPNLSGAFLASQRRAIMARTEGRSRSSGCGRAWSTSPPREMTFASSSSWRCRSGETCGKNSWPGLQLVPWLGAVVLLLLAILVNRPAPKLQPAPEVSDAQLFEDVFSTVSSSEPRAVETVRSLFQVNP